MTPIIPCTDVDCILIRLTKAQINDPIIVVEEYCDEYKAGQARNTLSQLVKIALMHDDRSDISELRTLLIEWAERTEKVLESLYAVMTILKVKPHLLKELSL